MARGVGEFAQRVPFGSFPSFRTWPYLSGISRISSDARVEPRTVRKMHLQGSVSILGAMPGLANKRPNHSKRRGYMGFPFNRRGKACVLAAATFFAIGSLAAVLRAEQTLTLAQAVQRESGRASRRESVWIKGADGDVGG